MTDTTRSDPSVREIPFAADGEVEILLTSNDLRLRGTDGDRVVLRARDGGSLDEELTIEAAATHLRVKDGGAGDLRLGPLRLRSGRPMDLDVDLPRSARVRVRTLSGDVDAAGIAGMSRWATTSGSLGIHVDGGPVSVESISGDVILESSVALSVTARSVSGVLRLRAPRIDALAASTTSGDMEIAGALGAGVDHVVSSVSGDVRLITGSDVRLDTQTVTGDVRASVPHRAEGGRGRRTLVVGDGRVHVSARTMSGDVTVQADAPARDPAAPPEAPVAPEPPMAAAAPPSPPAFVVAEASAAPNLVRVSDEPKPAATLMGEATLGDAGPTDDREAVRLDVLRALERGDLDVEAAFRRLAGLEDAGPRAFRGWF